MQKVIAYKNSSDFLILCFPTGETPLADVLAKDVPPDVSPLVFDYDQLPWADQDFVDAWDLNGNSIVINFAKAKEVRKTFLRGERFFSFEKLDVAFQRALETNADTTAIVQEKQRLRDITNLCDVQTTLDGLRALNADLQIQL